MKNEQLENTVIYMHLQQGLSTRKISEELKWIIIKAANITQQEIDEVLKEKRKDKALGVILAKLLQSSNK